jgi:hypothetical protein
MFLPVPPIELAPCDKTGGVGGDDFAKAAGASAASGKVEIPPPSPPPPCCCALLLCLLILTTWGIGQSMDGSKSPRYRGAPHLGWVVHRGEALYAPPPLIWTPPPLPRAPPACPSRACMPTYVPTPTSPHYKYKFPLYFRVNPRANPPHRPPPVPADPHRSP